MKIALETKVVTIGIFLACLTPYIYIFFEESSFENDYTGARFLAYAHAKNLFALIAWCFAFYLAKGKEYRFVFLLPILLLTYQFITFGLRLENTVLNLNVTKALITVSLFSLLTTWFYIRKRSMIYE